MSRSSSVAKATWVPSGAAPAQRRIDVNQFAFLRSVVLGLPLRDAADRYLGEGMDLRLVKRELRWLRTELLAAARRAGAWGDARALALDMAQLPTGQAAPATPQPSLEDFRAEVDPSGDSYCEAELLELYREQHPPATVERRGARIAQLRERQRRSLAILERVLVQPPTAADPPSAWLEPATAVRLERIGLTTLGKLADWIQVRGYRWFSAVPGVGEVAAARVVDWLLRNEKDLAIALDLRARFPRRGLVESWRATMRPEKRIAPLERLAMPAQLDGSQGTNRLQGVARIDARNDRQAIEAWLAARARDNAATVRAYRREAERLLLWAIFERNRPLSSMMRSPTAPTAPTCAIHSRRRDG